MWNYNIKKGDTMKEFRFIVEFKDSSCDFRDQKANTEDEAREKLMAHLIFLHKSPLFKGKEPLQCSIFCII